MSMAGDGRGEGAARPTGEVPPEARRGRLLARPGGTPPLQPLVAAGVRPLGLGRGRDGLLMVPEGAADGMPQRGMPLLVWLHGAGGAAPGTLGLLEPQARAAGVALLVPESRAGTWDVIRGGYGPDVAFVDAALRQAFAALPVDPARLAIGGFSDGASYALSLGLANGDLFRRVLAFSPGFAAPPGTVGRPGIYVSHGTRDDVLPIERCSRRLVPRLRDAGYAVRYEEFDGGHVVPEWVAADALALLRAG
jgi:phospholipase/carboxylesterase